MKIGIEVVFPLYGNKFYIDKLQPAMLMGSWIVNQKDHLPVLISIGTYGPPGVTNHFSLIVNLV